MGRILTPKDELLALRAAAGTTVKEIAKATSIPSTRISGYFRGYRELTLDDLAKIHSWLEIQCRMRVAVEQHRE